jgi:prophage regulatory protein
MSSTKILRLRDVRERIGLGTSSIYSLMAADKFPRPVQLGIRAVGWIEDEIDAFVAQRVAERDARILKNLGDREPTSDAERGAAAREMIRKVAKSRAM